jgi:RNA 2',3'-cyclic 3'-phosphodiesterase
MKRIRTFIALDIGPTVRDRIVSLQNNLASSGAEVKWVEKANLHLTLLFLGEVDNRDLMAVSRAVAESAVGHSAIDLSIEGTGCFPNMRRPRVVWIGVGKGLEEVRTLHKALEEPLLELGCYRREERQFTPHVTLGRIRSEKPMPELAAALEKKQDYQAGETLIREVLVMSSDLSSRGPIYTVMSRGKLR